MNLFLLLFFLISSYSCLDAFMIPPIPEKSLILIAKKIWENECNGSVLGLTHWNKRENFPSLGIGHFIWYPEKANAPFEESFPNLLLFLEGKGVCLPTWLKEAKGCPWKSREEFYRDIHSSKMRELRQFLFEHQALQVVFMIERLNTALSQILKSLSEEERIQILPLLYQLTSHPNGIYVLIDYLNFKGSGLSPQEAYRGKGWGLLQVLQKIPSRDIVSEFVSASKEILTERVQNAPPEREEHRYLQGWFNRLDTYQKGIGHPFPSGS